MLSIDLGSAYTKISLRSAFNADAQLLRDPKAPQELAFCIPSVVARLRRRSGDEWVIGAVAASQPAGTDVKRYWKASLFAPIGVESATSDVSTLSFDDAMKAAIVFFRGLRAHVVDNLGAPSNAPVRVCIPKLDDARAAGDIIAHVCGESGWTPACTRPDVYEPESNALGLLTRGRNATWMPPRQSYQPLPSRSISMQAMFDGEIAAAYRRVSGRFQILTTDIGAFTTDFGLVDFDTGFFRDWSRPEIKQRSVRLGVRQLDDAIRACLTAPERAAIDAQPVSFWESEKRKLYNGQSFMVQQRGGGRLVVGEGRQATAIRAAIEAFAQSIIVEKRAFLKAAGSTTVEQEFLSGGGSLIPRLAEILGGDTVARGNGRPEVLPMKELDRQKRLKQTQDLVRGGSAVGGASVFFEA